MNNAMIRMTGGLVDEDDSLIGRINIKSLSGEIKSMIFDSFASLDDNNAEDCFGLDIETAMKAMESSPSRKQHPMYETLSSLTNAAAAAHYDKDPSRSLAAADDASSNNSVTSTNVDSTKPKRPLSAYNLFFQLERERIIAGIDHIPFTAEDVERVAIARRISDLQADKPKRKHRKSHGKITFAELARAIANRWRALDAPSKGLLLERAALEKRRFLHELEEWTKINGMEDGEKDKESSRPSEVLMTSTTSSVVGKPPMSQRGVGKGPFPDLSVSNPSRPPMHPPNRTVTPDTRMKCAMEMTAFANMRISGSSPTPLHLRPMSSTYKSYQQQLSNQQMLGSRFDSNNDTFHRHNNDRLNNLVALNSAIAASRNHQTYLLQQDDRDVPTPNHSVSQARENLNTSAFLLENEIYNSQLQNDFAFGAVSNDSIGGMQPPPSSIRMNNEQQHHNVSSSGSGSNMDQLLANVEYELSRSKVASDKLSRLLSSLHRQKNSENANYKDYQGSPFM